VEHLILARLHAFDSAFFRSRPETCRAWPRRLGLVKTRKSGQIWAHTGVHPENVGLSNFSGRLAPTKFGEE